MAKWTLTKSHREPVWDFPFEKQTTVRSETVFIMHKYLSGYMSHCEWIYAGKTQRLVTMHTQSHKCGFACF